MQSFIFISFFLFSTGYSQSYDRIIPELEGLQKATDKFSIGLYKTIPSATQRSNLFISPLSINLALYLTYSGSLGTTRDELRDVLGLSKITGNDTDINRLYSTISDILKHGNRVTGKENYKLNLANRICLQDKLHLKQDFLQSALGSDVKNYNFLKDPDSARLEINSWVANITNGRIRNLLHSGQVDANTVMLIINAIYFKADWHYQFDKSGTSDMKFFGKDNHIIRAKMMTMRRRFYYTESDELKSQMVEIPYKSEELSMLILLPNETDGLERLERKLEAQHWQALQDRTDLRMVALTLPKFKLEESYDLVDPLRSLGVNSLFGAADLGGMVENGTVAGVSGVVHKSFVEVNEEGTEAAAATGVVFSRSAVFIKPDEVKEFKADHPFLFAIRHNPTNLILFMGRVGDPST